MIVIRSTGSFENKMAIVSRFISHGIVLLKRPYICLFITLWGSKCEYLQEVMA